MYLASEEYHSFLRVHPTAFEWYEEFRRDSTTGKVDDRYRVWFSVLVRESVAQILHLRQKTVPSVTFQCTNFRI